VNGVKGLSMLHNIISIPENVPLDYMHLIYLTVTKNILASIIQGLNADLYDKISVDVVATKVPIHISRQPRSFS
jgi:hypothetical protein